MAKRSHIDLSMADNVQSSEQLMAEQMETQLAMIDAANATPKDPEFETEHEDQGNVIFKLAATNRKGKVNVDGIDDVINPTTGKLERIRLITGSPSIWLKDQKDLTEDYVKQNRRSLTFVNRFLFIPKWDTQAVEFARICRSFIESPTFKKKGSKHAFFEWNPARQAEEAARKNKLKMEAMKMALSIDVEKMRKHALYLGVQFVDEVGVPKNDESLRNDYFAKAEADPKKFMESLDSKVVNISFVVKKAIRDNKIDLGRSNGMAYWAQNGGFICQIPMSRTATEYLVELAMTNSVEGRQFLDQLQTVSG